MQLCISWLSILMLWFTNVMFHLFFCHQVVFFGIDNIHAMRESLSRLRDYVDTHGTTSSDGMSSFLVSIDIKVLIYQISNLDV